MSRLSFKKRLGISFVALMGLLYYKRSIMQYGFINEEQLFNTVDNVVNTLGGGEPARRLLLETASAETLMGKAIDTSWNTGIGIMQFDEIGFDDVKQRTPQSKKDLVLKAYGIDIDRVNHTDLRWSPLLSVIFARLKYMLVPSKIPTNIQGRAAYWKRWYNSELGAGTIEHYVNNAVSNGLA